MLVTKQQKLLALWPFLLLLAGWWTTGAQGGTGTIVRVHIPENLAVSHGPAGLPHRMARFGRFPPIGTMTHRVYYADSDLCQPQHPKEGYPRPAAAVHVSNGTDDNDDKKKKDEHHYNASHFKSPYILLVDRNATKCDFVKQARNAQHHGAAAVLILDEACLCSDADCVAAQKNDPNNGNVDCQAAEPIMGDDGSGGDISIPALLLYKHAGDALRKVLKEDNHPVLLQLDFGWAPDPQRTNYELWTTPGDGLSIFLLDQLPTMAEALKDAAAFTPRQYLIAGSDGYFGCNSTHQDEPGCAKNCANHGRYCLPTVPTLDGKFNITGKMLVSESLRRLCIWDKYGATDKFGKPWWTYVKSYSEKCYRTNNLVTDKAHEACLAEAYKEAGIDAAVVDECMGNSGGIDGDGINSKLEHSLLIQKEHGVYSHPSAYVDRLPLAETPAPYFLMQKICQSLAFNSTPHVCHQCGWCYATNLCIELGSCAAAVAALEKAADEQNSANKKQGDESQTKPKAHHVFGFLLFFALCGYGGWYVYKKRQEGGLQPFGGGGGRGLLSNYMRLDSATEGGLGMAPTGGRDADLSSDQTSSFLG